MGGKSSRCAARAGLFNQPPCSALGWCQLPLLSDVYPRKSPCHVEMTDREWLEFPLHFWWLNSFKKTKKKKLRSYPQRGGRAHSTCFRGKLKWMLVGLCYLDCSLTEISGLKREGTSRGNSPGMQSVFPMFFTIKEKWRKHKCFISLPMNFHLIWLVWGGWGQRKCYELGQQMVKPRCLMPFKHFRAAFKFKKRKKRKREEYYPFLNKLHEEQGSSFW